MRGRSQLPAASAGKGVVVSPQRHTACDWITVGSRWRMIGATGEVLGEARVTRLQKDELWPCKMASFAGLRDGARLLVDVAPPVPTRIFTPTVAEHAAFLPFLSGRKGQPLFFESRQGRFALGIGQTPVIARWDGGWRPEKLELGPKYDGWERPAAVDVDGDGQPEVILGWWLDTEYGDCFFRRGGDGTWRRVAESYEGNTI